MSVDFTHIVEMIRDDIQSLRQDFRRVDDRVRGLEGHTIKKEEWESLKRLILPREAIAEMINAGLQEREARGFTTWERRAVKLGIVFLFLNFFLGITGLALALLL